MKIEKAVVTAAGPDQRKLPLQTLIDVDGVKKSVLEILIEEIVHAGISKICCVVQPGDAANYGDVLGQHQHLVEFVHQTESKGYGHALYCAHKFTGDDPFLHLVGDHLYVKRSNQRCAQHLVQFAGQQGCAVSAVQPTRENLIPHFGVIGGSRLQGVKDIYQVEKVIEKPTPTEAEQSLIIPGLRAGQYLCFFGMHVLTPTLMQILGKQLEENPNSKISLSNALNELAKREQYLALEKNDLRFDMGEKYGLLKAQMALALGGKDREMVMNDLLEFFSMRELQSMGGSNNE